MHGDLNARVGNEVIEGIVGRHGVPGRNESGERLLEMCAEQELVVCMAEGRMAEGRMAKNGGRKGGRQGTTGLCVATKMNAWKTVRCESVERRRGGGMSDHFLVEARLKVEGGWRSAGRMEGVRNVLKVSELNNSVKEWAYQESLRGKY